MARFQKTDAFKAFKISGLVRAFNAFNAFNAFKAFKTGRLSRLSKVHAFNVAGLSTLAAVLLLVLTGCGHNAVTYGDGIMLETTLNPETFAFGVSLRYGKILTACVRENVEIRMTGEGNGGGETSNGTGKASASGTVTIKTGKQTNGYTVEAIRARNGK